MKKSNREYTYNYDARGRTESVIAKAVYGYQPRIDYTYDDSDLLTERNVTYGVYMPFKNVKQQYYYHFAGGIKELRNTGSGVSGTQSYGVEYLTYNLDGKVYSKNNSTNFVTETYNYNSRGQLIKGTKKYGTISMPDENYAYDDSGNRMVSSLTYDKANRQDLRVTYPWMPTTDYIEYTYDDSGNYINDKHYYPGHATGEFGQIYEYDAFNRVSRAVKNIMSCHLVFCKVLSLLQITPHVLAQPCG